jgi:hypothetical protein
VWPGIFLVSPFRVPGPFLCPESHEVAVSRARSPGPIKVFTELPRETVRKALVSAELKPQKATKRLKEPSFAALRANMEAPEATLDPFRTVSEEVFSETRWATKAEKEGQGIAPDSLALPLSHKG